MNRIIYILLLLPFQVFTQNFGGKILYYKNRSISQIQYSTNQIENLTYFKNNNVKSVIFSNNCNQLPIPTISGNGSFCFGDSTLLTCNINNEKYLWSTGETTKSIWVKIEGSYKVTVTYNSSCIKESIPFAVTSNQTPLPIGSNVSYCQNSSAGPLSGTPSNNCTLLWYGTDATGGTSSSISTIPSTNQIGSIVYYVSQKDNTTNCESERVPIIVNIIEAPLPPIVSNNSLLACAGSSVNLNAVSNGNTINWYTQAIGGNPIGTSQSGEDFKVIFNSAITYYAEAISTNACLSNSRTSVNVSLDNNIITSPPIEWQKTYGGTASDYSNSIIHTSDGGYIMVGAGTSNDGDLTVNHGKFDFWIVKINRHGVIEWQKSYGGSLDDIAYSIRQTSDNGYIIAGQSKSNDGDFTLNKGLYDFLILKLDQNGNKIWQKSFGGSGDDIPYSIIQTNDLNYMVVGYTSSTDGDIIGSHGNWEMWVIKLSPDGNLIWQKPYGGSNVEIAKTIIEVNDNEFLIGGAQSSTDGDLNTNNGNADLWFFKINSNGNIIWQKSYGDTHSQEAHSIQKTSDNGFIIAGDTGASNGIFDVWVIKTDDIGNIIWQKTFGGSGHDIAYSVIQTYDEGYIINAFTISSNGDVTNSHGLSENWVIKLDKLGNTQWMRTLGGSQHDYAKAILQNKDGSYMALGYTGSNDGDVSGNHGGNDLWLIKLKAEISINSVSRNTVCIGSNFTVNFTTGINFPCNTTFTAQLSDAHGSFSNPTNIGTLISNQGSTIDCSIPTILPTSTNYRVRIVSSNGLSSVPNESNINIINLQSTISISSNSPICEGNSLNLTVSNYLNYSWTGPNSYTSNSQNPTINQTQLNNTGSYQVSVTDINGCSATASTIVSINPKPTISVSNNSPICEEAILYLSASGGSNYSWSGPNSFTSNKQNPSLTQSNLGYSGDYYVIVTDLIGCSASSQTSVVIHSKPTILISNNSPICQGSNLNLLASGGLSYSWAGPNSFNSAEPNPILTNVNLNVSGTYQVSGLDANGCSNTASTFINVKTIPNEVIVLGSGTFCGTATLKATGGENGTIYYQGTSPIGTSLLNPTNTQIINQTGIYYFRANNECGWGQEGSATIAINSSENSWNGSVNTAWENPNNWSCNQVPDQNTIVVIKSGMPNNPIISTLDAKCKKLTVETNSLLNFNNGGKLTLYQ